MDLKRVGTEFNRVRVDLNENFDKIEGKYRGLQTRLDNTIEEISERAFDKVVDRVKIDWLPPVDTFDDLATTYPEAVEGQTVMTRDTGKIYRMTSGVWMEIQDIEPTAINEVDSRLSSELAQNARHLEQRGLDIQLYGAVGDNNTDDTDAIQSAIDYAHGNRIKEVVVTPGIYLIDATKSIKMKSNVALRFLQGAVFKAIPNDSDRYHVIQIKDCENVAIIDAELEGEMSEHLGTTGEWGHGINIEGSKNVLISRPKISNMWGGWYLYRHTILWR